MSSQATRNHELVTAAWVRLLRAHSVATREFNAQLVHEHGLTINDYEVLLRLDHADGSRMRRVDLADQVMLTASGITRLLDGLQASGLVGRAHCKGDARVVYAVLTPEGRERLVAASRSHLAAVRDLMHERYSDEELELLAELLGRMPGARDDGSCEARERQVCEPQAETLPPCEPTP